MLAWFQALMPKQGRFFDQFEAHAATLVAGADALSRLLADGGATYPHVAEIVAQEDAADRITRDVMQDVRRVFVTPFDRSAITGLIGTMDDAIDEMNGFAKSCVRYGVDRFHPAMRELGGLIVDAARVTAELMPLLRSLNSNAARITELTERLVTLEDRSDDIHDAGVRELFRTLHDQPMQFIVERELYGYLEKIVDRFEDVADEVQGLVIDHA